MYNYRSDVTDRIYTTVVTSQIGCTTAVVISHYPKNRVSYTVTSNNTATAGSIYYQNAKALSIIQCSFSPFFIMFGGIAYKY